MVNTPRVFHSRSRSTREGHSEGPTQAPGWRSPSCCNSAAGEVRLSQSPQHRREALEGLAPAITTFDPDRTHVYLSPNPSPQSLSSWTHSNCVVLRCGGSPTHVYWMNKWRNKPISKNNNALYIALFPCAPNWYTHIYIVFLFNDETATTRYKVGCGYIDTNALL